MWVGVSAHVTDVGGAVPGGYSVEHSEVFGENVRFTPVKFYDAGKFRQDILDAFLTNTRLPEATEIDLKAITGAVWMGKERCAAMIEQHGGEKVRKIHAAQIVNAATAFRERLDQLPDGAYAGAAHMEHDGEDDKIYTIRATLIKEGSQLTVDYTGTDEQAPGVLNGTSVGAIGDAMAALGTVYAPELPVQRGAARAGHRDRSCRDRWSTPASRRRSPAPPSTPAGSAPTRSSRPPTTCSPGTPRPPRAAPAPGAAGPSPGCRGPTSTAIPGSGTSSAAAPAAPARSRPRDGENAMMGIQTIDAFIPNVEEYEIQSPVLFLDTRFAPDTGGAGRNRGGLALESLCTPYDTERWDVVVFHNRLTAPSSAVSGGQPGAGAAIRFAHDAMESVHEHWDRREELPSTSTRPPPSSRPRAAAATW